MKDDNEHHYTTLELNPGASWDEIRRTYRALVRTWHPDRLQDGSEKRRVAEEKTKEITRAYKHLADYYRKHGVLPPVTPTRQKVETETTGRTDHAQAATAPAGDTPADVAAPSMDKQRFGWKAVAGATLGALLIYLWALDSPHEENTARNPADTGKAADAAPHTLTDGAVLSSDDRYFMLGSKIGEVYSAQGTPTRTENDVWHYGKSKVYFSNGSVTHWEAHPDNPLKTLSDTGKDYRSRLFIARGSSKDEVMAIQGTPWHQTDEEWRYGSSRIFFRDGRVTDWEESVLNPLRVEVQGNHHPAGRQRE